ncbi:LOW QUALITY PROTEIN: serine/threonine-protein kinase TAO3-like [Haliotis rubra]|uniref:LOW QUALITY PROTEIN: serine/threonine-protein kinase TAO3-like n=1 Tax=Haliotis rubra TaxID=36100 RepID=UPI001EE50DF5|nr:LOW QUALITY PROTEIN: serine/threonine-protein kinase TAO3-like [Haliotis rubra]
MPSKPGSLKDPDVAGLFSTEDPEKIFTDLREIGHGSFGAVYFARHVHTNEIVAIKKMSYNGKTSAEKWQDILKEVRFIKQLKHRHTIDYRGCYLKEHTAWLVMEYCLGSASDIIEVLKMPLKELEIAAICHDALQGLTYLHSQDKIHRDVKAGNILLTENGTVKLADFGSASLCCPANSFVGTPYWMAPEVILAMDEGQYNGKADIWSLGITCIELAERKPPLFNMNAMSALYHIAQNDSPSLSAGEWSDDFRNFVDACLAKDPENRPSAAELLQNQFLTRIRPPDVILELIQRTKNKVRELDMSQYRRMKKLIIDNDEGSTERSPAPSSTDGGEEDSQDDDNLDGSRSDSLQSHNSNCASSHSSIASIGANISDLNAIHSFSTRDRSPPPTVQVETQGNVPNTDQFPSHVKTWSWFSRSGSYSPNSPKPSASSARGMELYQHNFATIRTPSIVRKEIKDHEHSNELREQFTGYKSLRKQHQKELIQLESRFKAEMEEHKQKLDREYENLRQKFSKEMEKLRVQHASELDRGQRNNQAQERKMRKDMNQAHDSERRNFSVLMKKNYKTDKERKKKDLDDATPKKEREDTMRNYKEKMLRQQKDAEFKLEKQQKDTTEFHLRKFRRKKVLQFHQLEQKLLKEEIGQRRAQLEYEHTMLVRHHESTQDLEYKHLAAIQKMRDEQLRKQHETERENQKEYTINAEADLRKKHALEVKQQPRSLKQKVVLIRRQFDDAVKTQQRQYKALKEHILQNTPKAEQKAVVKKLKDEQMRKLAQLGDQYEASIADMLQQQNVRLDESQVAQAHELKQRLQQELELLMAYQSKIRMQTEAQHQREKKQLEERVSLRRALLEQKMDEERVTLHKEEGDKKSQLHEKQTREVEEFDIETTSLGLNAMEIAEASHDPDDDMSYRGSMLSLSGSSSSSSFSSQVPT